MQRFGKDHFAGERILTLKSILDVRVFCVLTSLLIGLHWLVSNSLSIPRSTY